METGETKSKSEAIYVSPSILEENATKINTNKISLIEGNILFCTKFKYMGSVISNNLKDDYEINTIIKKENMQFWFLKQLFNDKK
jgi:hypothetical protein